MKQELIISASLAFSKDGVNIAADSFSPSGSPLKIWINGAGGIKSRISVDTTPKLLDFGEVDPVGYVCLKNLGAQLIKTPGAPIVTVEGLGGAASWAYRVLANQSADVNTVVGPEGTVLNANDTLTVDNHNFIQWLPVGGAVSYDIYRTLSGGTPDLLGWFANVAATETFVDEDGITYNWTTDTGVPGDGDAPPLFSPFDFTLVVSPDDIVYPIAIPGGGIAIMPWIEPPIYVKSYYNPTELEQTILPK